MSQPTRQSDRSAPRLIVCEKTSQWAVAIRSALGPAVIPIRQTRTLSQCWDELATSPTSLLALEVTQVNVARIADALAQLRRDWPRARAIALSCPTLAQHEWLLREAGAACVLESVRHLPRIVSLVRRHSLLAPRSESRFVDEVWASLPWGWRVEG